MGSSIGRAMDEERDREYEEGIKHLHELAERVSKEIKKTQPSSSEFDDVVWLFKNKAKIIRNRRLIDLIG